MGPLLPGWWGQNWCFQAPESCGMAPVPLGWKCWGWQDQSWGGRL